MAMIYALMNDIDGRNIVGFYTSEEQAQKIANENRGFHHWWIEEIPLNQEIEINGIEYMGGF